MTKKHFSWLLLAMGLMVCQNTMAWNLWVCNTQVTKSGQTFNPSGKSKGTIKYTGDGTSGTLTFDNVTYSTDDYVTVVQNMGVSTLSIKFVGNCSINTRGTVIESAQNTTVTGGQGNCATVSLTCSDNVSSSSKRVIWIQDDKTLTIRDINLTANGVRYCISGNVSTDEREFVNQAKLQIWTANVSASVSTSLSGYGAISHLKSCGMTTADTKWTSGNFSSSKYGVCDSSGTLLKSVSTTNSLKVGNVIVPGTDFSGSFNLYPNGLSSGSIMYDVSNNKLTLDNVNWSASGVRFIDYTKRDNKLSIIVKGTNNISASYRAIVASSEIFIDGQTSTYTDNVFKLTSTASDYALWCTGALSFRDVDATITSESTAIYGHSSSSYPLSITRSKILAKATNSGGRGLYGFTSCTLNGSDVYNNWTYFQTSKRGFADGMGIPKELDIRKVTTTYDVYVLGKQLNDVNAHAPGIEGMTGSLYYYPSDKKLELNGATITAPSSNTNKGIDIATSSAVRTIVLTGTNTITTTSGTPIYHAGGTLTIQGSGNLDASSSSASYGLHGPTITIKANGYVKFTGKSYGVFCNYLYLEKGGGSSDYFFTGNDKSINVVEKISIPDDMDFWTAGCYMSSDNKNVLKNGGSIAKGTVNIYRISTKYNLWVAGKQINNCNKNGLGSPNISGSATAVKYQYDSDNNINMLTLSGGTITSSPTTAADGTEIQGTITSKISGLTIKTTAATTIERTSKGYAIFLDANTTTMTGSGKLKTVETIYGAIKTSNSLTVKDANIDCGYYLYCGNGTGKLTVDNSDLHVTDWVYNFGSLSMENGTGILKPQLAFYDTTDKRVEKKNSNAYASNITFGKVEDYGISICGTPVTNANNEDVFGTGVFAYNPSSISLSYDIEIAPNMQHVWLYH